jgi:hypothetical protein
MAVRRDAGAVKLNLPQSYRLAHAYGMESHPLSVWARLNVIIPRNHHGQSGIRIAA